MVDRAGHAGDAGRIDYPVVIGIAAKPQEVDGNADIDALHQLRQDLKDFFFRQESEYRLLGNPAVAIGIETITDCDKRALRDKRLFLSEFVVTFRGERSRFDD